MRKLYRFNACFGRSGSLSGLFTADHEIDIDPAMGRRILFGEELGKHSNVVLDRLSTRELTALTDDAAFIAKFDEYGCASGYNPLNYITCANCGDVLPAPYVKCSHERCADVEQ